MKHNLPITLLLLALFLGAHLIIGLISKRREKDGITLLPIFLLISLSLFFMIRIFARTLLSGLFNF